jgi:hypothetical protein
MLPRGQNARDETLHCIFRRRSTSFRYVGFSGDGRAFHRSQHMLELWNNWYEILASAEALAVVIVIVVLGAGVITLVQSRRR